MPAATPEPKAKAAPSEVRQKLQKIVRGRTVLVAQRTARLNQAERARTAILKQQIRNPIKSLSSRSSTVKHDFYSLYSTLST